MASQRLCVRVMVLAVLLTCIALRDVSSDSSLLKIIRKRDVAGAATASSKSSVAVPSSKALNFLAKLSRTKRNLWDRSRPDVQQWIAQFMYMGFDEQRLETDLSYWMDQARSSDQGVSTTMMKTPPSARETLVLTDTALMSTTTTIDCDSLLD